MTTTRNSDYAVYRLGYIGVWFRIGKSDGKWEYFDCNPIPRGPDYRLQDALVYQGLPGCSVHNSDQLYVFDEEG